MIDHWPTHKQPHTHIYHTHKHAIHTHTTYTTHTHTHIPYSHIPHTPHTHHTYTYHIHHTHHQAHTPPHMYTIHTHTIHTYISHIHTYHHTCMPYTHTTHTHTTCTRHILSRTHTHTKTPHILMHIPHIHTQEITKKNLGIVPPLFAFVVVLWLCFLSFLLERGTASLHRNKTIPFNMSIAGLPAGSRPLQKHSLFGEHADLFPVSSGSLSFKRQSDHMGPFESAKVT